MENIKNEILSILGEKREIVTMVTKVAKSGMSRRIKIFVIKNDSLLNITYHASQLLKLRINDDGVLVGGCGMDMQYWITSAISHALFDNDYHLSYKAI